MFTTSNKRIAIYLGAFALLILVVMFVFNPLMESNTELGYEVDELRARHQELLAIEEKKDQYEKETEEMQKEIIAYTAKFPAEVRTEDAFVLAMDLEAKTGTAINNIAVGESEFLSSVSGISVESDSPSDDTTLSQEDNQATKDAINEIEGVEESDAQNQADGSTVAGGDMSLMRILNTMECVGSYDSLKNIVSFLNSNDRRMTIDTMTMSFDEATGGLSGSVAVSMYSMTNTNAQYQSPKVDGVKFGKKNIFGTVK